MGTKEAVVERFGQLCGNCGIAWNELAVKSGVTPSTVYSMLKKSRKDISIITIKKLCDGLDISLAEFFNTETFRNLEQETK